jgi:ATP-dependent DNA helicase RecG
MSTVQVEQALAANPEELGPAVLALREDQWFDRKSARIAPRELADVLIGFGNAEGGTVVVGVWRGAVEGTDRQAERRNALVQAAIDFSIPPVRARPRLVPCVRDDGGEDRLLVFDVEPGEAVHANMRDEVYLRVGDENRRLTFVQRRELAFDKGQATYEAEPVVAANGETLDADVVDQYADAVQARDARRLLQARGLVTADGRLTVAGCLLFAREPQTRFPEAYVRVLRYRGRERGAGARQQLVDDVRIEGPLPRQLLEARDRIRAVQPVRRALASRGRFEPVPLVPEDAWLEAVVNAVVHRAYSVAGDHIRVEVFDDRIEVSSPGRFPGIVDLSDPLDAPRFARNPRIARVLADLNFGQELGEGLRRMFEEMRRAGLHEPIYHQTSASVRVVLSAEPVDRELAARYPREIRVVVDALRTADRLSTGELAELLGVTPPTALKRLRALEENGLIEWVGKSPKDPRAYWTLPSS